MLGLDFATCDHNEGWKVDYGIEWDRIDERKYKQPIPGVRVYETGLVVVYSNGHNDPSWRKAAARLGLHFRLLSEMKGCTFTDPETGHKVPKPQIMNPMVLHDMKHKRIYVNRHDAPISFIHKDAQPVPTLCLDVRVPNKEKAAARRAQLQEYRDLGTTLLQVQLPDKTRQPNQYNERSREYVFEAIVKSEAALPGDLADPDTQELCKFLAKRPAHVERLVVESTKDRYTPMYLNVKEN